MVHREQFEAIVEQIKPHLADKPPDAVGAALAALVAIWLDSHFVIDDEKETRDLRDRLLKFHVSMVRDFSR
jgi:hemerythrin